jgi:putative phosphoesterase
VKIAILSDIHGNDVALQAVMEELKRLEIEHLFVLGDIVGYYYHPDRILDMLAVWNLDMIKGNHEQLLSQSFDSKKASELLKKYGSGFEAAKQVLTTEQIQFLLKLPDRKTVIIDDIQFELCHGSPWDRDTYIYPDCRSEELDRCKIDGADFVLMGHTHYPFVTVRKGTVIANVGSVGQARDQGGTSSWALIDTTNRSLVFKKTKFDVSAVALEAKMMDPHLTYLTEVLFRK